jgi:hypothetical protein
MDLEGNDNVPGEDEENPENGKGDQDYFDDPEFHAEKLKDQQRPRGDGRQGKDEGDGGRKSSAPQDAANHAVEFTALAAEDSGKSRRQKIQGRGNVEDKTPNASIHKHSL